MSDDRYLISVPEAASRLGIGITKAWTMARDGSLPGLVRIGTRSVRVDAERLRAWVSEQSAPSRPAA